MAPWRWQREGQAGDAVARRTWHGRGAVASRAPVRNRARLIDDVAAFHEGGAEANEDVQGARHVGETADDVGAVVLGLREDE